MKISTGEKTLMTIISMIMLLFIIAVYIKNFLLEQQYENCRHYAQGVVDILRACRQDCYPINPMTGHRDSVEIPSEFAAQYLKQYESNTQLAQRYYFAYSSCIKEQ